MYGEGYDEKLEKEDQQVKKFTIPELENMIEMYEDKIKELT